MMLATTQAPWRNPRVLSTLMLVFLAGAAAGALSMQMGLHGWLHRTMSTPEPASPPATLLEKFNTELGLTQDQSRKISAVLADYTQYYQSIQEQLDDVRSTGRRQILGILTPDQRDKFEKMAPELGEPSK